MPRRQDTRKRENLKETLLADRDFLKELVQEILRQVLEGEMEAALGAAKSERTEQRAERELGTDPGAEVASSKGWDFVRTDPISGRI